MEVANGRSFIEVWFDDLWNQGRSEIIDETVPPDALSHGLADTDRAARGPDAVRAFWLMFRHSFSDIRLNIEDVLIGELPPPSATDQTRREACRWVATAVHTGAFGGVMPTGRTVRVSGSTWMHLLDGQIRESFTNWDQQGLLDQLAGAR